MAGAGNHPVFWAAFQGDLDAVMHYTDAQPELLHQGNHKGTTALIWAAKGGCAEVAEFLLDKGADVNAKDNEGYTALYRSCLRGHLEVVELLLKRGADAILTYGPGRNTVLRSACSHGHAHVVKLLMVHGGNDVDVLNHYGRTPLSCACRYGHAEVVAVLLEAGADWTVVDKWGQTPLVTAIRHAHDDCVRVLMEWEVEYQLCKLRHMRDAAGVWAKHLQHTATSTSSSSSLPASAAAASFLSSSASTSPWPSSSSSQAPPAAPTSSPMPAQGTTASTTYTSHTTSPPPPPAADTPAVDHTHPSHTHVHTHACVPPFLRQRISDTHTPLPFPIVAIRHAVPILEGYTTACEEADSGLGVSSCGSESVCIEWHTDGAHSSPVGTEEGASAPSPSSSNLHHDDDDAPSPSCRHHDDDEDHHHHRHHQHHDDAAPSSSCRPHHDDDNHHHHHYWRHHHDDAAPPPPCRHHDDDDNNHHYHHHHDYCRAAPSSPRHRHGHRRRRQRCRHHHQHPCHQPHDPNPSHDHSTCGANGCAAAGCGEGPEAMRAWWQRWFGRGDAGVSCANGDAMVDESSVHTCVAGTGARGGIVEGNGVSGESLPARGDSTRSRRVEGGCSISEALRMGSVGGNTFDNDDRHVGVCNHADDHHDKDYTGKSGERDSRCRGSDNVACDDDASDGFLMARQVVEYLLADLDREVFIDMTGFTCAHHDTASRSSSSTQSTDLQSPASSDSVGQMSPAYVVVGRDGGEGSRGPTEANNGGGASVSVSHGDGC